MGFESDPPQLSQSTEELQENDPLPAYGPLDLTYRRTPSSVPRQWEQDKKRMSKTSFRMGRVRGMVETYERSFSESSASGSEYEEREDVLSKFGAHPLVCEPEEGDFASGEETSASDGDGNITMVSGTESASAKVPVENKLEKVAEPPSPPSVEALLREYHNGSEVQSDQDHSWGAKAWEDEANNPTDMHATAKRILSDTHTVGEESRPRVADIITESAGTSNTSKGLTELFSQLTIEERPPLQSTRDVGVSAGDGVNNTPVPGPAVYELLNAIQKRLEIVETRLNEMERGDAEKDKLLQQAQAEVEQRQVMTPAKLDNLDMPSEPSSHLPLSGVPHHAEQKKELKTSRNYAAADPSITELPRYMFLVSLGVVAITTRVVLQRMIGDRKRT